MSSRTPSIGTDVRVDRDMSLGRNLIMGGDATVRGSVSIDHGLTVKGWLDIENMNVPTAGVFETEMELNAAYPTPRTGMIAGVLDLSGDVAACGLYISQKGVWVDTQSKVQIKTVLNITTEGVDADALAEVIEDINDLESGKADKVSGATSGNFASLNSSGNLVDSGKKPTDFAEAAHTHGNIQATGELQSDDVNIAYGDKLVVTDSSDNGKAARSSVMFDGYTKDSALTPSGTFVTFVRPTDAITKNEIDAIFRDTSDILSIPSES